MRALRRRTRPLWSAIALVLACALPTGAEPAASQPIAAIVSKQWKGPVAVDLTTLRRIYLGQRTRVRGRPVRPLNLPLGSPEREALARTVLEESADALEHYWIRQALEGGPLPPREVSDAEAMLRAVRDNPTAIGYVALPDLEQAGRAGFRILAIEVGGRTLGPDHLDYPLRTRSGR